MDTPYQNSVKQLKEIVAKNNIEMVDPSGKYGKLIKTDYLVSIKKHFDTLTREYIILCEWDLVGSTERCNRPSVPETKLCWMYQSCIRAGKFPSVSVGSTGYSFVVSTIILLLILKKCF